MEDNDRRKSDPRIIVALVTLCITAITQLAGGIWWAATISSDLRHNTIAVAAIQLTQYTKEEANRDFGHVAERTSELARRIGMVEERMK